MHALFADRVDAGRKLAAALAKVDLGDDAVVVGLARGGVPVAAEVARLLSLSLDALVVRKIGFPRQPEYGIGAVAAGSGGAYVRSDEGLSEQAVQRAIEQAEVEAAALDQLVHAHVERATLRGRTTVLVDDGLATGGTMTASVRWARAAGASRVVVAAPVAAVATADLLRDEADEVVCLDEPSQLGAVGLWYRVFTQVETHEVVALLEERDSP